MKNGKKKRRVTQDDVARMTGVTRTTVSYVLAGRSTELRITKEVQDKVRAAAAAMGYVPHHGARSLATGRAFKIGLMVDGITEDAGSGFFGAIAEGAEAEILRRGYDVLILRPGGESASKLEAALGEGRVDAVIAMGLMDLPEPGRMSVPPVVLRPYAPEPGFPGVCLDLRPGLQDAVRALGALGHRSILWLGPRPLPERGIKTSRRDVVEEAAYLENIAFRSIQLRSAWYGTACKLSREGEIRGWSEALRSDLSDLGDATAVLCWNDFLAFGFYAWLQERGLRPGRDVSVVGFDNCYADCAVPALSSVSYRFLDMGRTAARLAFDLIEAGGGPATAQRVVAIPSEFVRRDSVASPRSVETAG